MANEQETVQVLTMCKQHPEVAAECEAIELSMEHYARIHSVNPTVKLKEKIFTAVNDGGSHSTNAAPVYKRPTEVVKLSSFWKYVAAASVILLIGSLFMFYNYYTKYQTAND